MTFKLVFAVALAAGGALLQASTAQAASCDGLAGAADAVNIYTDVATSLNDDTYLYDETPLCDYLSDDNAADSEAGVNGELLPPPPPDKGNKKVPTFYDAAFGNTDWDQIAKWNWGGATDSTVPEFLAVNPDFVPTGETNYANVIKPVGPITQTPTTGAWVIEDAAREVYNEIIVVIKGNSSWVSFVIPDIPNLPEYIYVDSSVYQSQNISHLSFYGRVALTDVPVPPAAPLLLGALGLLGWRARRKG